MKTIKWVGKIEEIKQKITIHPDNEDDEDDEETARQITCMVNYMLQNEIDIQCEKENEEKTFYHPKLMI